MSQEWQEQAAAAERARLMAEQDARERARTAPKPAVTPGTTSTTTIYEVTTKSDSGKEVKTKFSDIDKAHKYVEALSEPYIAAKQAQITKEKEPVITPNAQKNSDRFFVDAPGQEEYVNSLNIPTPNTGEQAGLVDAKLDELGGSIVSIGHQMSAKAASTKLEGNNLAAGALASATIAAGVASAVYDDVTFLLRPKQWKGLGDIISDPGSILTSAIAAFAEDPLFTTGYIGGNVALALKGVADIYDVRSRRLDAKAWESYKALPEEKMGLIPDEYNVLEKEFSWTEKTPDYSSWKKGSTDDFGVKIWDKETGGLTKVKDTGSSFKIEPTRGKWSNRPWDDPRMALTLEGLEQMEREGIPLYELTMRDIPVSYYNPSFADLVSKATLIPQYDVLLSGLSASAIASLLASSRKTIEDLSPDIIASRNTIAELKEKTEIKSKTKLNQPVITDIITKQDEDTDILTVLDTEQRQKTKTLQEQESTVISDTITDTILAPDGVYIPKPKIIREGGMIKPSGKEFHNFTSANRQSERAQEYMVKYTFKSGRVDSKSIKARSFREAAVNALPRENVKVVEIRVR